MNKLKIIEFPKKHPLFFSVSFTSFKTGLADYLVQTYIEKEDEFCYQRFQLKFPIIAKYNNY